GAHREMFSQTRRGEEVALTSTRGFLLALQYVLYPFISSAFLMSSKMLATSSCDLLLRQRGRSGPREDTAMAPAFASLSTYLSKR
ncbi:hypothetical protein, partial [Escherichia coli]|uniref:hypothetical protein n=1 Tax=Escherichia coli TaxID=562 RepID=UPI001BDBA4E9